VQDVYSSRQCDSTAQSRQTLLNLSRMRRTKCPPVLLPENSTVTRTPIQSRNHRGYFTFETRENSLQRHRYSMSTEVRPCLCTSNADPHVGHMHSMVVADVIKRYKELTGKKAILSTGTDEHGMKVLSVFSCVNLRYKKRPPQQEQNPWSFVPPRLKSLRYEIWEMEINSRTWPSK
jgi:hypothetical protein